MDEIKITKKSLYLFGFALFVVIIILAYVYYRPNQVQSPESNVNEYKKDLYESIVCQYSCPLFEAEIQNATNFLPNATCIADCINNLKSKKRLKGEFPREELLKDSLFSEIDLAIQNCKNESAGNLSNVIDNGKFFECSSERLRLLKNEYEYLK